MNTILLILSFILIAVVLVQIGRASELSAKVRGEEVHSLRKNNMTALWLLVFMVLFLVFCTASAWYYKDEMLAYGPNTAASIHGLAIDGLFNWTTVLTGIVFFATQFALFFFAWKFRFRKGGIAKFMPHDNRLEVVWTLIPTLVMTFLVVQGLIVWNDSMADVKEGDEYIEIEATGEQFLWTIRYPGDDQTLGVRDYRLTSSANQLGQDWNDMNNHDDFIASDIVLPVDTKIRVNIRAKDVLHNFYLPHQRVKMDAIPGTPTFFVFTPTITTVEYKERLRDHEDWNELYDETDPELGTRWENFNYELACAELCGSGHYSMRKILRIVEQDEYEAWLKEQKSTYFSSVRNTDNDPYAGTVFEYDRIQRKGELGDAFNAALEAETEENRIIRLNYVQFETGSNRLTADSRYELDNVIELLKNNNEVSLELGGHTDNTGDAGANLELSQRRAEIVKGYLTNGGISGERLTALGYGQIKPIETNDTPEGRAENRRTELKILSFVN